MIKIKLEELEGAEVTEVSEYGLTVEKDGQEFYISGYINHTGCSCCGDTVELKVTE